MEDIDLIEEERAIKDWFIKWLPLICVMLLQAITLIVMPMFDFENSEEIFVWKNPEWYEWVFTGITELLTITTFIGFSIQGKLNVKDDPRKLEADKILGRLRVKEARPQSPKAFESKAYISKGIMVSLTALGTCILIPIIAISFNLVTFFTLLLTTATSIVFGVLNMKRFEDYYTHEYIRYAEWKYDEVNSNKDNSQTLRESRENKQKQASTEVENKGD